MLKFVVSKQKKAKLSTKQVPSIKYHINIDESVMLAINSGKVEIPNIQWSHVIKFGDMKKLNDLSFGLKQVEAMEDNITKRIDPRLLREDFFYFSIVISVIVAVLSIKILYKVIRKFLPKIYWIVKGQTEDELNKWLKGAEEGMKDDVKRLVKQLLKGTLDSDNDHSV